MCFCYPTPISETDYSVAKDFRPPKVPSAEAVSNRTEAHEARSRALLLPNRAFSWHRGMKSRSTRLNDIYSFSRSGSLCHQATFVIKQPLVAALGGSFWQQPFGSNLLVVTLGEDTVEGKDGQLRHQSLQTCLRSGVCKSARDSKRPVQISILVQLPNYNNATSSTATAPLYGTHLLT